ncbi:HPr kinase/phosphatase C-terminal domain-containing protein [Marivita sp. GX14005]|uniref:HPr kinase/phosphorylase n=1 Tax=Marivita sp. GX14005 TaxID=2942276 RepID=UPI002018B675|nr:HPr kinase/phosphatase C-terminal domain-containing protein [Marivita sp. GX14005]MCL3882122.1 HPr kinase/phosphatase C-terminal domain-containing protein [Marivita sp. GX14005]
MVPLPSMVLHGSAVAVNGRAVLIIGASGSGKSALALEMMARGAVLVADDQVRLNPHGNGVVLTCPKPIAGMIEARGVGLIRAEHVSDIPLALVVDLDQSETERMPPERSITYLGIRFPLIHNVAHRHFPAALIQYLNSVERVDE